MKKVNLLFASLENYENWKISKSDWRQTITDINISDLISFLISINEDFPFQFINKPCINISDAEYRLDVMDELFSKEDLLNSVVNFIDKLKALDRLLTDYYMEKNEFQKSYKYIRIVFEYCLCINTVKKTFCRFQSKGFKSLFKFYSELFIDNNLIDVYTEAEKLNLDIENMLINNIFMIDPSNKTFFVEKCDSSKNESKKLKNKISQVFGIDVDINYTIVDPAPFGNMEEKILGAFCDKYPDIFKRLKSFFDSYLNLIPDIQNLTELYSQLLFYSVYITLLKQVKSENMNVCKPILNDDNFMAENCACPSLVIKCIQNKIMLSTIVLNSVHLPKHKIFMLSGPNQGGKTMYLKSVGMTAFLAKCGCFVFCDSCVVPFYDMINTHFMQKEIIGKGRLVEEIERIDKIIDIASANSLLLLNESFATTRRKDGVQIAMYYINKINDIGCSVGFVSHYYEIPELYNNTNNTIISLSCGIYNDGMRTYKILENSGTGFAYARDIAQKEGMTYGQIHSEITRILNEKH